MPRRDTSRTRILLFIILVTILLAYMVSFAISGINLKLDSAGPGPSLFTLDVSGKGGVEYEDYANAAPSLPSFDPAEGQWSFEGERLLDLGSHMQGLESHPPYHSNPFIEIELPSDATVDTYHKAVADLLGQGICRVGVFSPRPAEEYLPPHPIPGRTTESYVQVYGLLAVKSDNGSMRQCRDRFPPWPF